MKELERLARDVADSVNTYALSEPNLEPFELLSFVEKEVLRALLEAREGSSKEDATKQLITASCL